MNPNYILWAIPFFLLTLIGELIHDYFKKGRKDFNFEDNVTKLNLGVGIQTIGSLLDFDQLLC